MATEAALRSRSGPENPGMRQNNSQKRVGNPLSPLSGPLNTHDHKLRGSQALPIKVRR